MSTYLVQWAMVDSGEVEIEADNKLHAEHLVRVQANPNDALHREWYFSALPMREEGEQDDATDSNDSGE